jgi:AcrR family transcriptional regulator
MSTVRERLSPEESRSVALEAARALLIEEGPQAVTLKAVAARVGRTHANLLHHFGSAAGLQGELAKSLALRVTAGLAQTVDSARRGEADVREIVDCVFDAFGKEGGGALAAWMLLSGNRTALDPILGSIRMLVNQITQGHEDHAVPEATLKLVLAALGDSLLGAAIAEALNLRRDTARELAAASLRRLIESHHPAR